MNQFYTAESVTEGHPDKPVSYTHLDVYKRQEQLNTRNRLKTAGKPQKPLKAMRTRKYPMTRNQRTGTKKMAKPMDSVLMLSLIHIFYTSLTSGLKKIKGK